VGRAEEKLAKGDFIKMKKPHPCGENKWEIIRLGMDVKLKCQGCGRLVTLPRKKFTKNMTELCSEGENN